jgi:hypothetical protein
VNTLFFCRGGGTCEYRVFSLLAVTPGKAAGYVTLPVSPNVLFLFHAAFTLSYDR